MRRSLVPVLIVALSLSFPAASSAASVSGTMPLVRDYTRSVQPLTGGAYEVRESIEINGMLADAIRKVQDWRTLQGQTMPAPSSATTLTAATVSYYSAGMRYAAYNSFGSLVIQYTIWQTFGYDGTNITYFPASTYDSVANYLWTLTSHHESHGWITSPTFAQATGTYSFSQSAPSPWGNIGFSSKSGWVEVFIHGNGSYSGTGS